MKVVGMQGADDSLAAQLAYTAAAAGGAGEEETRGAVTLWAVSDLHVGARGNRDLVSDLVRPRNPEDWLIVAGDVAEDLDVVIDVLAELRQRFAKVIYAPGNHELYARAGHGPVGKAKYEELIRRCRRIGIYTPEDPYQQFAGHTIVPLFTLYDHSWRDLTDTPEEAIAKAHAQGLVLSDYYMVRPFVDVPLWCRERLAYSVRRLGQVTGPTVLVNHWPLAQESLRRVRYPEIGLFSGTRHTQQWGRRYRAAAVIHGHLHIPLGVEVDGVPHVEVSLGYPRERKRSLPPRQKLELWPYPVIRVPHTSGPQAGFEERRGGK